MKLRLGLAAIAALAATHADVYGLNPPADSDGPIRLLACVVSANGMLEAEVDSRSEDDLSCNIHCNYELAGKPFTHWFEVTIPRRFIGRVGHFDTSGGRTGNFSGEVGTCRKTEARGAL